MAIFIPFMFLMFLIYNWILYIILTSIALVLCIGLYFLWQYLILKNTSQHFSTEWLSIIASADYQQLIQDTSARRYISKDRMEQIKGIIQNLDKKPEKTRDNFEDETHLPKMPIVSTDYKLIGKPCPICHTEIQFGDFCVDCNVRFCPKCGLENSPYSKTCICGFAFTPLEIDFLSKFSPKPD